MVQAQPQAPQELVDALDSGELTREQLRELAELEAARLGLTFDEAVELARKNKLPMNPTGSDGNHLLKTMQYRYMLTPDDHSEPRIRWEYVGYPIDDDMHCRHHLQGPIPLNLSDEQNRQVTLNDLHLPTAWVPVGRCCASVSLILE
ncbi:hypothetical protein BH24CHL1_BH24CHL1_15020 [soil metagenome]